MCKTVGAATYEDSEVLYYLECISRPCTDTANSVAMKENNKMVKEMYTYRSPLRA